MDKKQLSLNMVATIVAFIAQSGVDFYATPIIIAALGNEAYGYIGLAKDFIMYASVVATVFNSVAGRFISIEINRGNIKRGNEYFSSVLIANIILSIIFAIAGMIVIFNITNLFSVTPDLVNDVKITFAISFSNYILTILISIFTVSAYVKNRIDATAIRNTISYLIKLVFVLWLFTFFSPKMYFLALATIASTLFLGIANINLTRKIMPEIVFKFNNFRFSMVKELIASGGWLCITNLSNVMLTGLDLLLANIFLGGNIMGLLSTGRTIPNAMGSLIGTIGVVFTPQFVIEYANNKKEEIVKSANYSIKIMGFIMATPIIFLIVFGTNFYTLWLPTKNVDEITLIQIISVLVLIQSILNSMTMPLAQLSVVTNRLKIPVFVSLSLGLLNVGIVITLLKTTNIGVYAIAGVSSILLSIRYFFFNPMYAAYILGQKKNIFYKSLFRGIFLLTTILIIFVGIRNNINISSWKQFIISAFTICCLGYLISFLLLFSRGEQANLISIILLKIKHK